MTSTFIWRPSCVTFKVILPSRSFDHRQAEESLLRRTVPRPRSSGPRLFHARSGLGEGLWRSDRSSCTVSISGAMVTCRVRISHRAPQLAARETAATRARASVEGIAPRVSVPLHVLLARFRRYSTRLRASRSVRCSSAIKVAGDLGRDTSRQRGGIFSVSPPRRWAFSLPGSLVGRRRCGSHPFRACRARDARSRPLGHRPPQPAPRARLEDHQGRDTPRKGPKV